MAYFQKQGERLSFPAPNADLELVYAKALDELIDLGYVVEYARKGNVTHYRIDTGKGIARFRREERRASKPGRTFSSVATALHQLHAAFQDCAKKADVHWATQAHSHIISGLHLDGPDPIEPKATKPPPTDLRAWMKAHP